MRKRCLCFRLRKKNESRLLLALFLALSTLSNFVSRLALLFYSKRRAPLSPGFFSFHFSQETLALQIPLVVIMRAASSAAATSCSSRPVPMSSASSATSLPPPLPLTAATLPQMPRRSRARCVRVAAAASDSGACVP